MQNELYWKGWTGREEDKWSPFLAVYFTVGSLAAGHAVQLLGALDTGKAILVERSNLCRTFLGLKHFPIAPEHEIITSLSIKISPQYLGQEPASPASPMMVV